MCYVRHLSLPNSMINFIALQLDAKNSPLALLAKTCSNIGKDDSAKSIIPPIERSDKRETSKSTSPGHRKSPHGGGDDRDRVRSPESAATSDRFKLDSKDVHSPRRHDVMSPRKTNGELSPRHQQRRGSSPKSPQTSTSHNKLDIKGSTDSKISLNCGSLSLEINHKESNSTSSSAHVTSSSSPTTSSSSYAYPFSSSAKLPSLPHHASLLSAYYPHLAFPGYPGFPGVHPAALGAETAALLAAQRQKTESAAAPHVATSYNPVKTASGATTLVPVCSDPYCVSCKLAMQSAQLAAPPCGAGCTQCSRDKSLHGLHASLGSAYQSALGLPGLHSLGSLYGHGHHSSGSLSAHSNQPYVCSWMSGTNYCGERFSTSEELMTHLRTHTTSLEQSALHSGLSAYSPSALAGLSHLYPSLPSNTGSLSPTSLSRYPRSLSPSSLLAARYHPYLKPGSLPPALPTSLSSALPGVHPASLSSAYPSLYPSLHASRFGSALVP